MLRTAADPVLRSSLLHILIVDPDHLQPHNLLTSRLYHEATQHLGSVVLGRSKAEVSAEVLQQHADTIRWEPRSCDFAALSWHALQDLDLLISCTDNALARVEATFAARALGLPLLDGGVFGEVSAGGRVTWFSPEPQEACYLCGLGEQRRAALLAYASALTLSCLAPQDASLGDAPSISPSLEQTAEALIGCLRLFCQAKQQDGTDPALAHSFARRLQPSEGQWSQEVITLHPSATCPWHGGSSWPLVSLDPDRSFADQMEGRWRCDRSQRLQFAWPICTLSACPRCGWQDVQPRRLAVLRRTACYCAICAEPHQLEPLRLVSSIGHNDPVARMTPRQLGLAERQLLQLRPTLAPAKPRMEAH